MARTHDNFSSSSFDLADTSYLIDTNTGLLYDESLKVLGDYPGWLTPVDPGLYSSDEAGLAYYEIGEHRRCGASRWTMGTRHGKSRRSMTVCS